jgi:hypothetical protein
MAVSDDILQENIAGPGDDVYMTELFSHRPGRLRNTPIMRAGTIAAPPDEPIQTRHGEFAAYLVEARSTPGLNGCPVFLNPRGFRRVAQLGFFPQDDSTRTQETRGEAFTTGFYLLGVGYGLYDTRYRVRPTSSVQRINMGIGLVVPAEGIMDLLGAPDEVDMRDRHLRKLRSAHGGAVTPDSLQ